MRPAVVRKLTAGLAPSELVTLIEPGRLAELLATHLPQVLAVLDDEAFARLFEPMSEEPAPVTAPASAAVPADEPNDYDDDLHLAHGALQREHQSAKQIAKYLDWTVERATGRLTSLVGLQAATQGKAGRIATFVRGPMTIAGARLAAEADGVRQLCVIAVGDGTVELAGITAAVNADGRAEDVYSASYILMRLDELVASGELTCSGDAYSLALDEDEDDEPAAPPAPPSVSQDALDAVLVPGAYFITSDGRDAQNALRPQEPDPTEPTEPALDEPLFASSEDVLGSMTEDKPQTVSQIASILGLGVARVAPTVEALIASGKVEQVKAKGRYAQFQRVA